MSEGGFLPWKRQQLRVPKTANYNDIKAPLELPKGKAWSRDPQTREWTVVDLTDGMNSALAIPVGEPMGQHETIRDGRRVDFLNAEIVQEGEKGDESKDIDLSKSKEELKFISHSVLPTDTLQGICIKYSTTPTLLRQYNIFSGSNLASAPSTLIIIDRVGMGLTQPQILTPEQEKQKLVSIFLNTFKKKKEDNGMFVFGYKEAVAYLEMSDWNVDDAMQDAREDYGWEKGDSYSETTSLL
jgi:hypothetical protein